MKWIQNSVGEKVQNENKCDGQIQISTEFHISLIS